ncbi:hypothetical protein PVAP13_6NG016131 [Panicum virgatum]|uniref:Uncharacterized protein n=1 Tax=Panicum virgatum TaxID=38727 RepID=A0A8T0QTI8_PANVG|nr:hypothetical protein PVAP13_6NG016131 [Panicum virgatum]
MQRFFFFLQRVLLAGHQRNANGPSSSSETVRRIEGLARGFPRNRRPAGNGRREGNRAGAREGEEGGRRHRRTGGGAQAPKKGEAEKHPPPPPSSPTREHSRGEREERRGERGRQAHLPPWPLPSFLCSPPAPVGSALPLRPQAQQPPRRSTGPCAPSHHPATTHPLPSSSLPPSRLALAPPPPIRLRCLPA